MKERLFLFSILLTSVPSMETSILIIIDLSHFRGQPFPAIHNFVRQTNKQINKQTNKREPTLLTWGWFLFPEGRKSYVLLADGLSVVSWRFLYTCGYLWDSFSKELLMPFLTSCGVFFKKGYKVVCAIFYTRKILWVRCSSSRALFKSSSWGRGRGGLGSVTEQSRVKHNI